MKILFVGDASNYHVSLAQALATQGHNVVLASNGSTFMHTRRDINLVRNLPGKIGGALLWLKINRLLSQQLKGFDVVQISNPVFVDLKPCRVKSVFDRLRAQNGIVCLTALGTDTAFIEECIDKNSPLAYNEWRIGNSPGPQFLARPDIHRAWLNSPLRSHTMHIYENVDGVVSALYEYHIAMQRYIQPHRLAYGGIPIDMPLDSSPLSSMPPLHGKVKILMGYHSKRLAEKGTDKLIEMCRRLETRYPDKVEVDYVHDVPFNIFTEHLQKAHIVVDQLYSYTPATTALMAMAQGKVAVSGAEPEFYDFIGEHSLHPIINADPLNLDNTFDSLVEIINNHEKLQMLGNQSREFVAKHNAAPIVARRFTDFWERRLK